MSDYCRHLVEDKLPDDNLVTTGSRVNHKVNKELETRNPTICRIQGQGNRYGDTKRQCCSRAGLRYGYTPHLLKI